MLSTVPAHPGGGGRAAVPERAGRRALPLLAVPAPLQLLLLGAAQRAAAARAAGLLRTAACCLLPASIHYHLNICEPFYTVTPAVTDHITTLSKITAFLFFRIW